MPCVLERYAKNGKDSKSPDNFSPLDNVQEIDRLTQFTQKLKNLQNNMIGDDLERLSLRDVILLEQQMNGSLGRIHAKKDELLLDKLEDFEQKVRETHRTTNTHAKVVEKRRDFCSSEETGFVDSEGQGDCEHHRAQEVPQTDALPVIRAETSEQCNHTPEGLSAAKHFRIMEDLNCSPLCAEE